MKPKFYDFMELFEKNIIVEHIASEPLCWSPEDEDEQKAFKKMNDNNFDLLPIIQNGKINECLTKDKITRAIGVNELLSNSMPLTHILNLFSKDPKKKFFILKENKIVGIVTIGDLQKGPLCLLIFGLITNFEIMCYELIKEYYNFKWEKIITSERLNKINNTYNYIRAKDEDIDKLSCTTLSDKLTIIRKIPHFKTILENTGWSNNNTKGLLKRIERLRNNLAHAISIKTKFKKWDDILETIERIQLLTLEIKEYLEKQVSH